jgi:hypothetical protein
MWHYIEEDDISTAFQDGFTNNHANSSCTP